MKAFFALLLLGNVAFAVFQWFVPYEQLFVETRKVPAAEELQLLSDAGSDLIKQEEVVAVVEARQQAPAISEPDPQPDSVSDSAPERQPETRAIETDVEEVLTEPEVLVTEEISNERVCYTIGPLKDRARAIEISGRYSRRDIETALRSSLEKQYMGMMVYIDGLKTRNEALKTANQLSSKGVRDHIIVNEADRPNFLSLGVFGLKKNAEGLRDRVVGMGFKAKTEARYRERTIYWVYAEQSSEAELPRLLGDAEFNDGISQIPTQCLPT